LEKCSLLAPIQSLTVTPERAASLVRRSTTRSPPTLLAYRGAKALGYNRLQAGNIHELKTAAPTMNDLLVGEHLEFAGDGLAMSPYAIGQLRMSGRLSLER